MGSGMTTTSSLADSLPKVIASARVYREFEGVMPQLVDKVTLGKGEGTTWYEVLIAQHTAQAIGETTVLDNPQEYSDTSFGITPTSVGIMTRITDRTAARISKNAYAQLGGSSQAAIQRKKDEDGLAVLDGLSNSYPGSGSSTLTSGHIAAAMAIITGNSTEPGPAPYRCVLHPWQIRDIEDELVAGVGTYPTGEGLTARVFKEGFRGMIAGAQLYADGNISTAGNQAKGGVFAQKAIILVQGIAPRAVTVRQEHIGGGATDLILYDEYAYGERADHWGVEIFSDATAPTS